MSRLLVPACVLAVLSLACSEPPTKELHQAEAALAAARAAGAEKYAPDDLQAAEAALQKYSGAIAQRDYRQALNFAQDARDRAFAAEKLAATEKVAAEAKATKLIADVETLVKVANARLAGAVPPRLSPQAADRVRAAVRASADALQEARTLLDQKDFRGAVLRLTPVNEALRKDISLQEPPAGRKGR